MLQTNLTITTFPRKPRVLAETTTPPATQKARFHSAQRKRRRAERLGAAESDLSLPTSALTSTGIRLPIDWRGASPILGLLAICLGDGTTVVGSLVGVVGLVMMAIWNGWCVVSLFLDLIIEY